MFKPSDILIDAFVERVRVDFVRVFGAREQERLDCLVWVARMALTRMTFTNALYTNLTMSMLTTQVATDILHGRVVARGDVSADDWLHFTSASLCYLVGFVRGSVKGDSGRSCVIDEAGNTTELQRGQSDGALYPWGVPRGKLFVQQFFRDHALIDGERLASCIEYTHYPALPDRNRETGNWPGLLRGAQTIAVVSDPRFTQRLKFFYLQLKEAGVAQSLSFNSAADVFDSMPSSFWKFLFPMIGDAIDYLKYTGDGQSWLANMNAHMLQEEHREMPDRRLSAIPRDLT